MALPVVNNLNTDYLAGFIMDISSSTAQENSCIIPVPYRAKLLGVTATILNAITSANSTVTVSQNGTSLGTMTIVQSGSAAGNQTTFSPTSATYLNNGDYITVAATGSSTRCPTNVIVQVYYD